VDKPVTGKIVISRLNFAYPREILELLYSLAVTHANFAFPHALGNARIHFDEVVPRYRELKPELSCLIQTSIELGTHINFEAVPFCVIPEYPEYVGELYDLGDAVRLFTPVGQMTRDWNDVRPAIKRKGPHCKGCCYDLICEGPWEEYIARSGDEDLTPVPFAPQPLTKLLQKMISINP
jgi:hypothetical protein